MSTPGSRSGQPLSASEERTWAMVAHIGVLVAAWLAMGFLCPLIIWLVLRDRSQFVRRHAVESLNFQISLLIYTAVAAALLFLPLGPGVGLLGTPVRVGALAAVVGIRLPAAGGVRGDGERLPGRR